MSKYSAFRVAWLPCRAISHLTLSDGRARGDGPSASGYVRCSHSLPRRQGRTRAAAWHGRPRCAASLSGWLATGSSSASGCAPSRRPLRRRSWSGAAPVSGDKLARHTHRTARAWSLDGQPLLGISVFAAAGIPPDELLSARFAAYRMIHLPAAAPLRDRGFGLLPAGLRPHYTIRLRRADSAELGELLAAPGPPVANLHYAKSTIWREEGHDVPRRPHRRG
jgi:hypothetical protein